MNLIKEFIILVNSFKMVKYMVDQKEIQNKILKFYLDFFNIKVKIFYNNKHFKI